MRNAVDNVAWKGNTGYGSAANPINIYCDVRPGFAECDANTRRPASIMQRHFTSLYTNMFGTNARAAVAVRRHAERQRRRTSTPRAGRWSATRSTATAPPTRRS